TGEGRDRQRVLSPRPRSRAGHLGAPPGGRGARRRRRREGGRPPPPDPATRDAAPGRARRDPAARGPSPLGLPRRDRGALHPVPRSAAPTVLRILGRVGGPDARRGAAAAGGGGPLCPRPPRTRPP